MQEGITDADLKILVSANPLAAEQLRRIIAERNRTELQAEIDAFKASANSVGTEVDVADAVIETT